MDNLLDLVFTIGKGTPRIVIEQGTRLEVKATMDWLGWSCEWFGRSIEDCLGAIGERLQDAVGEGLLEGNDGRSG